MKRYNTNCYGHKKCPITKKPTNIPFCTGGSVGWACIFEFERKRETLCSLKQFMNTLLKEETS